MGYHHFMFAEQAVWRTIPLELIPEHCYEKNVSFYVQLESPEEAGMTPNGDLLKKSPDELTNDEKVALEGRPKLGTITRIQITIRESDEFKNTVDKLVEKRGASALTVSTTSWKDQFSDAVRVNSGDEEEGGEPEPPGVGDYIIHALTIFWKVLFAFVPPTDIWSGYLCFVLSIIWIGILTAFIGDLASHFGCTVGIRDSVTAITFVALGTSVPEYYCGWACFWACILWIGILTAIIGDVAAHFGCSCNLKDSITAISLVAMGTSLPDTFASKVSAIQDSTADNSVGNVTGSNAVNVFLGIGIAWSIAALYHSFHGQKFQVEAGNLAFSVTLFCSEAVIAIAILLVRRTKSIGGELGGPVGIKYFTSLLLFGLWVVYVTLSTLEAYHIIQTF